MVVPLNFQLKRHTRLLQKVSLDVGGGDLALGTEVDTDELTLDGRKGRGWGTVCLS